MAYTYLIYHIKTVFPKITCLETMATRVAEVKYNVEHNHEVPLTDQMKKCLEEFCNGTRKSTVEESTSAFPQYSVPAPTAAPAEGRAPAAPAAAAAGASAEGAAPVAKRRRLADTKR